MATPSYWWTFQKEKDPALKDKQELVIRLCSGVGSGAQVVIEAFETKKPLFDKDFKWMQWQRQLIVQFPVPDYKQQESVKHLTENILRLLKSFSADGYKSFAIEVDRCKTWSIKQFSTAMISGFLNYIHAKKNPPGIQVSLCTTTESKCKELCKCCNDILVEQNVNDFHFRQINEPSTDERFVNIEVLQGDICQIKADAIVNTTSPELDLSKGKASQALLKAAGPEIQKELSRRYKRLLDYGQIAVTKGYSLPCKYVFHGFLERYDENACSGYKSVDDFYKASVSDFMKVCIKKAVKLGCATVSFPVIGTGTLYYPLYIVAEQMFETVENLPPSCIKTVKIVIYGEDDEVLKMFQDLEHDYAKRHNGGLTDGRSEGSVSHVPDSTAANRNIKKAWQNGQSEREDGYKEMDDDNDNNDDNDYDYGEEEEGEKKASPKVIAGQNSVDDISSPGKTREERSFTGKSAARSLSNLNVSKKSLSHVETDVVTPPVSPSSPILINSTEDGRTKFTDSTKFTGDIRSKDGKAQTDMIEMNVTFTEKGREVKFGGSHKFVGTSDKQLIVKVSEQEYDLFEHFESEVIESYKHKGCLLCFEDGSIVLYGDVPQNLNIHAVKIDVWNAIKKTKELLVETFDVHTYDKEKVKRYAVELTTNDILCIVDSDVVEVKVFCDSSDKLEKTVKEFKHKLNNICHPDLVGGQFSVSTTASSEMEKNKPVMLVSDKKNQQSQKSSDTSSVRPKANEKQSLKAPEYDGARPKSSEQQHPKVTETSGARPKIIQKQFSWSTSTKHLEVFYIKEKLEVRVYQADIRDLPVLCIVNAANNILYHGGGIAKVISEAAGPDLDRQGHDYIKQHGKLKVGEVCDTTAGKLHYECVIHAVGPDWSDYKPHRKQDIEKCEMDLYNAVLNSIKRAEYLGLKSIAIPGISSGVFGCPRELCCMQYCKAVTEYGSRSVRAKMVEEIHFVDMNADIVKQIKYTFKEMIQLDYRVPHWYDVSNYVALTDMASKGLSKNQTASKQTSRTKTTGTVIGQIRPQSAIVRKEGNISPEQCKPARSPGRSHAQGSKSLERRDRQSQSSIPSKNSAYPYTSHKAPPGCTAVEFVCVLSPKLKLYVYTAEITHKLIGVDMIACGETEDGDSQGKVTKAIEKRFGEKFVKEKKWKFKDAKEGDIVMVNTGQDTKFVAHVILYQKINTANVSDRKGKMSEMYRKLFMMMMEKKCRGLALPLLGTGKGRLDIQYSTESLLDGLQLFAAYHQYEFSVHLINTDPEKTKKSIETIESQIGKQKQGNYSPGQKVAYRSLKGSSKPPRPKSGNSSRARSAYEGHQSKQSPTNNGGKSYYMPDEDLISGTYRTNAHGDKGKASIPSDDQSNARDSGSFSEGEVDDIDGYDSVSEGSASEFSDNSGEENEREADPEDEKGDNCVICMEVLKSPTRLVCGHEFCGPCITEQFTYKKVCPMCGRVCGLITGDQPDGKMSVKTNKDESCAGFEGFPRIEITYKFPDGKQGADHPNPGKMYKGITRVAFLPSNKQGKLIEKLLRIAFDRKLVFTIGSSRTTGQEGVITWNDIHHKTDAKPNTQFGYPDPGYLDRVLDELAVKGVTEKDLDTV